MIYQLPSGKAIELSLEQYLDMSDSDLDNLNTYYTGESIEDPWFGSVLTRQGQKDPLGSEEDYFIEDLTSITNDQKLLDPDIDIPPVED